MEKNCYSCPLVEVGQETTKAQILIRCPRKRAMELNTFSFVGGRVKPQESSSLQKFYIKRTFMTSLGFLVSVVKYVFFFFWVLLKALGKNQVTLFCNDVMFLLKRETP